MMHMLKCNWVDANGNWSCIANDGYTWHPRRVVLLNSFPLNAFSSPVDVKIYPVNTVSLLDTLSKIPMHDYKCFIGHKPTADLLTKYLPSINCIRGMYTYNGDDLLIAFVLKTRPNTSGVDVNVDVSDLLAYVIVPSPIL